MKSVEKNFTKKRSKKASRMMASTLFDETLIIQRAWENAGTQMEAVQDAHLSQHIYSVHPKYPGIRLSFFLQPAWFCVSTDSELIIALQSSFLSYTLNIY